MILDFIANVVSRLVRDSAAHNALNTRTIELYFQKSPGWDEGDSRGIQGIEYQVMSGGAVVQSGRTEADGKIDLRVTAGRAELQILWDGNVVASYEVELREDPYEAGNTVLGVQRRLRTIGYHLGRNGDRGNGIEGTLGVKTDQAILDFQIDNELQIDGAVGGATRRKINDIVGLAADS